MQVILVQVKITCTLQVKITCTLTSASAGENAGDLTSVIRDVFGSAGDLTSVIHALFASAGDLTSVIHDVFVSACENAGENHLAQITCTA